VAVLKEHVALIVSELEVPNEVASKALREVSGPNALVEALRLLITS
jgi:NACalpha-BTF3-like transcription factor